MDIENLIFDVDGTLWDTTPLVAIAWNAAVREFDSHRAPITADDLRQLFGTPMDYIISQLFPEADSELQSRYLRRCCEYEDAMLLTSCDDFLYPNVRETIKKLSESKGIYIVSNCQMGYIETFLRKSGLSDYCLDFESFGATGLQKADNIRLVVKRNNLKNAAYVGDIQRDCDAARNAGVYFIHASYGFGKAEQPDLTITSFDQLLHI